MKQLINTTSKKVILGIFLISLALTGTVFSSPYFALNNPMDWEDALANGHIRPIGPIEWQDYMAKWQDPSEGEPYPDNVFFDAQLYVYGGGADNETSGLVMRWAEQDPPLQVGSFSSAFIYDYGVDPDLTNCTIQITVLAPQFDQASNSQINAVSLGIKDAAGFVRGWQWACGDAASTASIKWDTPTVITVNTSITGVAAGTPVASGYMSDAGFDITQALQIIVDENATWNWQGTGTSVPPPGTTLIETPWNLWQNLSVSKNPAGQINVGINIDVHQGNAEDTNDYHIEGRIESGMPNGNWADPPVLVQHIDGDVALMFPNFTYTITPDTSDSTIQNWYNFTADWSGVDVPFCTTIHLGLLFDVTCHNIIIDLVGWWTKDGVPMSNEPILGFDVQDGITTGDTTQTVRLVNNETPFDASAMDIVVLPSGTQVPFDQLRGGTPFVEGLPWQPLIPLQPGETFHVDSFFDITFEIDLPDGPLEPGGILILRQNVPYIDGQNDEQDRWFFEIHEAHEPLHDLGDAPDSSNTVGVGMTAYPLGGPTVTQANYPTVFAAGSPPHGPKHLLPTSLAFLGNTVSGEQEADVGIDVDPTNNIIPPTDKPDRDLADDGVLGLPFTLTSCQLMRFNYLVNVTTPNNVLYANVWFDWNRDGDWDDSFNCQGTAAAGVAAPEWAVQNQQLINLPMGLTNITSLPFRPYLGVDTAGNDIPEDSPIWMRITLSARKWQPGVNAGLLGEGGSGPQNAYQFGETEDYYFIPNKTCKKDPDLDCSGFVDGSDFVIFARKWLQTIP